MIDPRPLALKGIEPKAYEHLGLLLDRGLNEVPESGDKKAGELGAFIRKATQEARKTLPEGYATAFEHRKMVLGTCDGGFENGVTRFFEASLEGRLVVGIGRQSVLEVGLQLHHTWSVPVLSGSSLKGLASTALHRRDADGTWRRAGQDVDAGENQLALFGSVEGQGLVTFHDAWWIPGTGVRLEPDVMTVHHQGYYGGKDAAPSDTDEPNPVPFVTIAGPGKFLVALSGPADWVALAGEALAVALAEDGAGAKTAAGYGRLTLDSPEAKESLRRAKEAAQRAERVRGLVAGFTKPSDAERVLQEFARLAAEGVAEPMLEELGRGLLARNEQFWKAWGDNANRDAAQRRLVEKFIYRKKDLKEQCEELVTGFTSLDQAQTALSFIADLRKRKAIADPELRKLAKQLFDKVGTVEEWKAVAARLKGPAQEIFGHYMKTLKK